MLRLDAGALLFLLAAFLVAPACRADPVDPAHRDAPPAPAARDKLRLVLIGDAGEPNADRMALMRAVKAEAKDAVVDLGDLVYPYAPSCKSGEADGEALAILDERLGAGLVDLGVPTYLVLGNHDIEENSSRSAQEACYLDYAAHRDALVLPAPSYTVDYGVALLAVTNTNTLTDAGGQALAQAFAKRSGGTQGGASPPAPTPWHIAIGHHVLRTFRDKGDQDVVRPWLAKHGVKPDIWLNGHAHLLQFGVYDGIPALTSGTGSLRRERATCPPDCGPGELYGSSVVGYAVLELTAERMDVTFKDAAGKVLYTWSKTRPAPVSLTPPKTAPQAGQ